MGMAGGDALRKVGAVVRAGLLGLAFLIALDVLLWLFPPNLGWGAWKWTPSGAVGIAEGVSIELQTRSAHPFLAEYDQRLRIYRATHAELSAVTVELPANTGGRTAIMVYAGRLGGQSGIELVDRFGRTTIDLGTDEIADRDHHLERGTYLGMFSARVPPLKFVPAAALPESLALRALP